VRNASRRWVEGELLVKPDEDNVMFKEIKNWFMQRFMKDKLIEALRSDLKAALVMVKIDQMAIESLADRVQELLKERADSEWWRAIDEERARQEAEERSDEVNKLIRREATLDELRVNKLNVTVENEEYIPVHARNQAE
jgi:thiamine pyrophosphate-dependent acetolactate synthase large subunit-like protein